MKNKILLLSLMLLAFESSIAQVTWSSNSYWNDCSGSSLSTTEQTISSVNTPTLTDGELVIEVTGLNDYQWMFRNVLQTGYTIDINTATSRYMQFDIKNTIPIAISFKLLDNAGVVSSWKALDIPINANFKTYTFHLGLLTGGSFNKGAVKEIRFENISLLRSQNTSPLPTGTVYMDNIKLGEAANPNPTTFSAVGSSNSQMNITWNDKTTGELSYILETSTASGGPFTVLATLPENTTSYEHTGLSATTTYYIE
jgi:hypothetical protein